MKTVPKLHEYEAILDSRTGLLTVVGAILFAIPTHVTGVLGFIFLFTAFDVAGYHHAAGEKGSASYRIMQVMFQAVLTFALAEYVSIAAAIGGTIAWYLLTCDVIFYWAVKATVGPFSWFHFSPVVFLYQRIMKQEAAPAWSVLVSSLVGLVLALSLDFIL